MTAARGPRELSGRHAEILAVLALAGRGLTAEQLTLEVYGERGKPVTLRAEMSRLRRQVRGLVAARPYRLTQPLTSDLQEAEDRLAAGRLRDALALAQDGVLPGSEAPLVVEARERLEQGLRTAILTAQDPELLRAWCHSALGHEDEPAARALLALLRPGDARVAGARAQLGRVRRMFADG